LAVVEEEIRESEGRLEEIAWRLGDPEVHRNPDAIREVETERDEIRSRVDELYREWERLAAEVEAGEQGMGG
jgi:protein subunit release factor A